VLLKILQAMRTGNKSRFPGYGPNLLRYSVDTKNARTISAPIKSPLNWFSLFSQKLLRIMLLKMRERCKALPQPKPQRERTLRGRQLERTATLTVSGLPLSRASSRCNPRSRPDLFSSSPVLRPADHTCAKKSC
jgi:hypothetical protein